MMQEKKTLHLLWQSWEHPNSWQPRYAAAMELIISSLSMKITHQSCHYSNYCCAYMPDMVHSRNCYIITCFFAFHGYFEPYICCRSCRNMPYICRSACFCSWLSYAFTHVPTGTMLIGAGLVLCAVGILFSLLLIWMILGTKDLISFIIKNQKIY